MILEFCEFRWVWLLEFDENDFFFGGEKMICFIWWVLEIGNKVFWWFLGWKTGFGAGKKVEGGFGLRGNYVKEEKKMWKKVLR